MPKNPDRLMNFPKITIITPSLNQGKYIEQTIKSVLDQGYPNLEYIIIDGGSSDNSIDIIKKYEKHLSYWISEPDNGQAHAINKGLRIAKGDLFNWLNSDDYLAPGALFELSDIFSKEHPDAICGFTHCFYEESGKTSHTYRMGIECSVASTIFNVKMNQPGTFYRTDWVKKSGGLNESLNYVFDDELWFRYLCDRGLNNIYLTDKLLAHFRLHEKSKSIGTGYTAFNQELNAIFSELSLRLNFPKELIEIIDSLPSISYYSPLPWQINLLNEEELLAWFYSKYQYTLYKNHNYHAAREAVRLTKKWRIPVQKSKFFALYLKLFLIPRQLLMIIRNSKRIIKYS